MAKLKLNSPISSEISKTILEKTKAKMGFAPNMYVKMGYNPALLDAYQYAYNSFRQNAGFTPIEQEVILLSVAYENTCTYCMPAHIFVADKMSIVPTEITDSIRNGAEIPDTKLASLSAITRALTRNRGSVEQEVIDDFISTGYTESHVLGIIAGIAVKTMSNYANHNTSPEIDEVFADRKWTPVE